MEADTGEDEVTQGECVKVRGSHGLRQNSAEHGLLRDGQKKNNCKRTPKEVEGRLEVNIKEKRISWGKKRITKYALEKSS